MTGWEKGEERMGREGERTRWRNEKIGWGRQKEERTASYGNNFYLSLASSMSSFKAKFGIKTLWSNRRFVLGL